MRTPCDELLIRAGAGQIPCGREDRPWIIAATILGSSMAFIDSTVVNVALPAMQTSLHTSVVGMQWVVEAYGLFLAALILAGGSLGDRSGRRRIFLAGVVVFAIVDCAWVYYIENPKVGSVAHEHKTAMAWYAKHICSDFPHHGPKA